MSKTITALMLLTLSQASVASPGCILPVITSVPIMSPFALGGLIVVLGLTGLRVLRNRRDK